MNADDRILEYSYSVDNWHISIFHSLRLGACMFQFGNLVQNIDVNVVKDHYQGGQNCLITSIWLKLSVCGSPCSCYYILPAQTACVVVAVCAV